MRPVFKIPSKYISGVKPEVIKNILNDFIRLLNLLKKKYEVSSDKELQECMSIILEFCQVIVLDEKNSFNTNSLVPFNIFNVYFIPQLYTNI